MRLKVFNVSYSEVSHFMDTKIEAIDKPGAEAIFLGMLNSGEIVINNTETSHFDIDEDEETTKVKENGWDE